MIEEINLRLFEGGGADGSTGDGQGMTTPADDSHVADENETDVKVTSNTLEDRRKAFDALIQGEYKDEFQTRTQKIIDRRFKQTKQLQAQVDANKPIIDMLAQRYGVSDPEKIMSALESDNAYWQEVADEAGMTVDQYKEFQRLKRENDMFNQQMQAEQEQREVNERAQRWFNESEEVEAKYPQFNLSAELENPEFVSMLQANVPMLHAFEVLHLDDIKAQTQLVTEKAVTQNIRAKGNRPQENGVSSQSATVIKKDVSKLTKKEREEMALRAQRGEYITF